jgi:hypothetical protein
MHPGPLLLLIVALIPTDAPQRGSAPPAVRWPSGNAVISRSEMCKPENRTLLGPLKIAGIHWGGALYADDETVRKRPGLIRQIGMVHAAGAKYIGSVNGRGLLLRGIDDAAVRLLDGSTFRHEGMNNAVYKCSLNPKVHAALLQAARQSIDIGMDGLILDSWQAEGQTLCFCTYCLEFYRQCLSRHRDDPRLKDLAGIDAGQFDYGEYLRTRGFNANTPGHKLPLGEVFQDYRFRELLDRKRSLLAAIRQYAGGRGRSPFYLTANVYSMQPITFAIDDLLDYFSVECPYFGSFDGYPPRCSSIALLKKAHAVGKRCVLQPGCHDTARALIAQNSTSTLFKIWVAEAYAAGHLFDLIPREFAGYENGQMIWLKMPVEDLLPYYRFVQAHPEIYVDRASLAKVAVLYNLPAAKAETPEFEHEYQAVCKILYDCHYQFDIVLSGDGEWGKGPVSPADLSPYDNIIVIRPQLVDSQTEESLLAYAAQGGKLLLCGQSRAKRPGAGAVCRKVLGREIAPREMPSFVPYIKSLDGSMRDHLTKDLGPDRILSTDAPPTVGIQCWKSKSRTSVHLLNYAYDQATDTVKPAENMRLRLRTSARRASLLSPDDKASANLQLKTEGPYVSCIVPRVWIYSMVVFE